MILLEAKKVSFGSSGDEISFFRWLDEIQSVKDVRGQGDKILIEVKSPPVPDQDLKELIALFDRYDIDLVQLLDLETPLNKSWLSHPGMYWFERMYGEEKS